MKCLIVDDDELSRQLIAEVLREVATSEMAPNGTEAVKKFRAAMRAGDPYDLIILDIIMPGMDGHEAAKAIRGIEQEQGLTPDKGVSIIVLSCLNTPKDVIESYVSAQSAAHLVKPVSHQKLMKSLRTLELVP
ncbi:response regulator [Geobacter sp. SVR]|uniref:response regulator n=1 Tax=Geobacter sp. SVR TaxID=2495594 RepID=UPI00143EFA39|nr:response regulator [Geobacter sp. SVR]BCS52467.1 response regulator [Geobacter sp. SVR]GCF84096.1 response regulator [Geobacter sp. SVR]